MSELLHDVPEVGPPSGEGRPAWLQAPEELDFDGWAETDDRTHGLLRVLGFVNQVLPLLVVAQTRLQNELSRRQVESDQPVKPLGALLHEVSDVSTRLGLAGFQLARELDVVKVVEPEQAAAAAEDEAAALAFDRRLAEAVSLADGGGDPSALVTLAYPPGTSPQDMTVPSRSVLPRQD